MKHYTKTLFLLSTAIAYNNPSWKTDADGKLELKDGNPVYVDSSGKEMIVEMGTISRLNGEAKTHREAKEAAEAKLKAFEGLDASAAREAMEKLKNIDQKKLIDAGEVEKVRTQIQGEFTKQLEEKDTALKGLQGQIDNMHINAVFANSEFVRESIAVPLDMFEASFRNNFKVEDGKVVAYGKDGNKLLSKTRAGEYATPDEALHLLVEQHPQKDVILKADLGKGTGSNGNGGNRGNGLVAKMTRSTFDSLTPAQKADAAAKAGRGELLLTD